MALLNNMLSHFALHPAHLFALLFVMALGKSTVLISSVLPPASVMLLAGITLSQSVFSPVVAWIAIMLGATLGSVLSYHAGQRLGHTRLVARLTARHADKILKIQSKLQKNSVVALFGSRFVAVLRYIVPLAAGMLRLSAGRVYAISLLSAAAWAALYVGAITGISAF
ncbi:VTT domain-containing protein [Enterobacter sp. RHBSTW-00994]|uniref:DedA family protein n=1 Tax=Enterobacteriaceae TaxID=543 RepID=UPI0015E97DB5|nr:MULTISPECIES: VTT domain-containing protein [Enterobacteriaceae]MBM3071265.1 DedA family protein [Lelliottia sp. RWM.1]QLR42616.1 VTT domain-containing protein [Enterobacter sp. RHBSTW-00994]